VTGGSICSANNKIVVGTTDTLVKKHSLEPIALETEINLFRNGSKILSKTRGDVLFYAGLRPLAAPKSQEKYQRSLSSHKIIVSDTGNNITGGKWTV
jgi:glycerol-3-phosphate dehydrogenase